MDKEATVGVINLNVLAFDSRLVTISDAWQEYRFTRLTARCWLDVAETVCIGYTPTILSSQPTNFSDMSTLQQFAIGNGSFGAAYPKIACNKNALLGAALFNWYRRGTGYDDLGEIQGQIYVAATTAFNVRNLSILIEYEVELRAPAGTGMTLPDLNLSPEEMAKQLYEMQQVLGIQYRFQNRLPRPTPLEVKQADEPEEDYVPVKSPAVAGISKVVSPYPVPATPKPGLARR